MVISCSAFGCTNRQQCGSRLQFHRFPLSDPDLLEKWLNQLKRKKWQPTRYSFLCGAHFSEDCYISGPEIEGRRLIKGAIPTIFNLQTETAHRTRGRRKELEEQDGDMVEDPDYSPDIVDEKKSPLDPPGPSKPTAEPGVDQTEFPEGQVLKERDDGDSIQNSAANVPSPSSSIGSKDPADQDDLDFDDEEDALVSALIEDTHCYGTKRTMKDVLSYNRKLIKRIKLLRRQVNRKDAKIKELKHRLKTGDYDDPEVFTFHIRATYE